MKEIAWGIMLIILITMYVINNIAIKRKNKQHQDMLQYINTVRALVTNVDLRKSDECYKVNLFFRMYNTGTGLEDDPGKILFQEIGKKEEYYW